VVFYFYELPSPPSATPAAVYNRPLLFFPLTLVGARSAAVILRNPLTIGGIALEWLGRRKMKLKLRNG
jgi:hypothetical protein